jgi:hypothetical protein
MTDQLVDPVRKELAERLDRLISAASRLAGTIAETERIAGRSAAFAIHGTSPRVAANARLARSAMGGSDRLVPLAEVARRTGRHPDLLRRWCLDGRLDAVRIGRTWCLPERKIGELGRFQRRRPGNRGDSV